MLFLRWIGFVVWIGCLSGSVAFGDDWPGWLGPGRDGSSGAGDVPTRWSTTENIAWQVDLEGAGNSSPIVWSDQVIITATTGIQHDTLHVLSFQRSDGTPQWSTRLFGSGTPVLFTMFPPERGNALSTPCTDGQRIVALFGTGDIACLDMDGHPKWFRALNQDYGEFTNEYGVAASPVLADGKVVIQVDQAGDSYLIALDGETGQTVWRTPRTASDNWTTPALATIGGCRQVICSGTYQVIGYDWADGTPRWTAEGVARLCTPTPLVHGSDIIVSSAPDGAVVAWQFDLRSGSQNEPAERWRSTRGVGFIPTGVRVSTVREITVQCPRAPRGRGQGEGAENASVISRTVLNDLLFLASDRGIATCFDAQTGQMQWQERIGGTYRASLIAAGGNVYFTSLEGVTTVVRAASEYQLVSRNDLGQSIAATPAITEGALFVRTERQLICIRADSACRTGP